MLMPLVRRVRRVALYAVMIVSFAASAAWSAEIVVTSIEAWPNGRTTNELPPNAIDGDTLTFTWTTNPNNIADPSHLAIGFARSSVFRLRLWKESFGGGGQNVKDLVIQYTNDDTGIPLSSRTWVNVTGLVNGVGGSELLDAIAVNANGTVGSDGHDSPTGDGWGSLRFDAVNATGLRISFRNPNPVVPFCNGAFGDQACNHYRVGEFEVYGGQPVPGLGGWSVAALCALVMGLGAAFVVRRPAPARVSA